MKPFGLEEYKAGAEVTTREGLPVEILKVEADVEGPYTIIGICEKETMTWTSQGLYNVNKTGRYDLVLKSTKKEAWANLYDDGEHGILLGSKYPYVSKEAAVKGATKDRSFIKAVKLHEWEE